MPTTGSPLGDPIDGRFTILTTDDGGANWKPSSPEGMPPALAGEGAFAASGTCLVVEGRRTPGSEPEEGQVSRVFRSTDRGRTWTAHDTPILAGNASSGIFSLAFRDPNHGVAVGGDYKQPDRAGHGRRLFVRRRSNLDAAGRTRTEGLSIRGGLSSGIARDRLWQPWDLRGRTPRSTTVGAGSP